jgi:hypothetical protein
MPFIVAHPGSLFTLDTVEAARKRADAFRETKHVKIYEIREVGHCFPSGPKDDPGDGGPGPAGAGEVEERQAKAA